MTRITSILAVLVVVAILVATAIGRMSGSADAAVPPKSLLHGNFSVQEARAMTAFPVYYAGDVVAGLPLSAVERRDDVAKYVSFLYGDCKPSPEAGCPLPLEVQVWPACVRNLSLYNPDDPLSPPVDRTTIRGVPAGVLDGGLQLELQTRTSTIVVFGASQDLVATAARALRGVNNLDQPSVTLAAPATNAVEGTLPCS